MRRILKLSIAASIAAMLSGCAGAADAPLSPTFGEAVASLDSQIIPVTPDAEPAASSAARGVIGIRRYDAGKPKEPQTDATSAMIVLGGGSSGDAP